jgi:hypothetical protein
MNSTPMVAVSVWGGAHDGSRFLVSRQSIRERIELRFLGDFYLVDRDRTGWKAIYSRRPL